MSNTQLRIISAIVMVAILLLGVWLGQKAALIIVFIVGVMVNEEIMVSFLKRKRTSILYILSQLIFTAAFWKFNTDPNYYQYIFWFAIASLFINLFLFGYLFKIKMDNLVIVKFFEKYPFIPVLMVSIPLFTLSRLILAPNWVDLLWSLIFINFSVDTFAWLFGKFFGKNKLWPEVSPKKTIEGAIGGVIGCLVLGGWYLNEVFHQINFTMIIFLFFLAVCAQLGDLVQSKLKRQFNIKDSSNFIPGHGGFYDRIDSLLFVCPLFLLLLITTNQI
jgi:phosphatidate cytidylyltransferase